MHGSASSIYNGMMNKFAHGTLKDVVVKKQHKQGKKLKNIKKNRRIY